MMKALENTALFVALCAFAVWLSGSAARAEEGDGNGASAGESMGPPVPPFKESILFSPLEVNAVRDAVEKGRVREVVREEAAPDAPVVRYLRVSGVTYRNEQDWVVWLNGQMLTPESLLPEIIDIKVRGDRVFLTWFDRGRGMPVTVTIRPNQTYDILSGLLLPG
jgi:hypothetical protein